MEEDVEIVRCKTHEMLVSFLTKIEKETENHRNSIDIFRQEYVVGQESIIKKSLEKLEAVHKKAIHQLDCDVSYELIKFVFYVIFSFIIHEFCIRIHLCFFKYGID
jgi:hypothetical protein